MNIFSFFKKRRERSLMKKLQKLAFDSNVFGSDCNPLDAWFEKNVKKLLKCDDVLFFINRRPSLAARFMRYVPCDEKTQRVFCRLEPDVRNKPCLKYSGLFEMYIKYYGHLSPEIERMIFSDEKTYSSAMILLRIYGYRKNS